MWRSTVCIPLSISDYEKLMMRFLLAMIWCMGFGRPVVKVPLSLSPSFYNSLRPWGMRSSLGYSWTYTSHMMPWIGTYAFRFLQRMGSAPGRSNFFIHTGTGWPWWPETADTLDSLSKGPWIYPRRPLYPTLFNVVMDSIVRHWVMVVAETEE